MHPTGVSYALLGERIAVDEPGLSARNDLLPSEALAMLPVLGLPTSLGDEFRCILPGYEGTLSSVVDPPSLRYETLYAGAPKPWWSLAEVYASRVARRIVILRRGPSHHRWWQRLRYDAGLLEVALPALDLPPRLSVAARRLARGFAFLHALSAHRHGPEPISFSRRFAMDWCALPERAAGEGLRELRSAGVLAVASTIERGGRRPTALYELAPQYVATGRDG